MKIGFTGTQIGMSQRQKDRLRWVIADASEFHHGDCIGADAEAHEIALGLGLKIVIHPPLLESKRAFCKGAFQVLDPKEYLDRNRDIVDCCQILIAAPRNMKEELRSGTWSTIRYAKKTKKPGLVLAR